MRRYEVTLARLLLVYALGVLAGVQGALYLYDSFDDGVSEPLSGAIAAVFLMMGVIVVIRTRAVPHRTP
jgi:hypothetical protein